MRQKMMLALLALLLVLVDSCSPESPQSEESPSIDERIAVGVIEIGENIHYSSQCFSGDLFFGIEYTYDRVLDEQNIVTFNLNTGEKELFLEFDPLLYRIDPPAVDGNLLVWAQADVSGKQPDEIRSDSLSYDIYVYDMETEEMRQITNDEHVQRGALISDKWVIWLDDRNDSDGQYPYSRDVYAYNLDTGVEKRITADSTAEDYADLSLSNNLVVWSDNRHGDPEVTSRPSNIADYNNEIYAYDLNKEKEYRITHYEDNDHYPAIQGSRIAWLRQIDLRKADIMIYDLESEEETKVSSSGYADYSPSVYGERVVWMDAGLSKGNTNNDVIENGVPGGADIFGYDFASGEESLIIPSEIERESDNSTRRRVLIFPVISEDYLVYIWGRMIGSLTYVKKLETN